MIFLHFSSKRRGASLSSKPVIFIKIHQSPTSSIVIIRRGCLLVICCFCILALGKVCGQEASGNDNKAQIEQVLKTQANAWNAGNLEAFMAGYAKESSLRFASGGSVTYGWQETLNRYKQRYPDRTAMGLLTFSELDITVLSADAALVFGRWRLKTDQGEPDGLFTLLFRKQAGRWQIVADHTSASKP